MVDRCVFKRGETSIAVDKPHPYRLPVRKLVATKELKTETGAPRLSGLCLSIGLLRTTRVTNQDWERMVWMAGDLVTKGVLQRWAYVACYSVCLPGQEDATYERLKEVITRDDARNFSWRRGPVDGGVDRFGRGGTRNDDSFEHGRPAVSIGPTCFGGLYSCVEKRMFCESTSLPIRFEVCCVCLEVSARFA